MRGDSGVVAVGPDDRPGEQRDDPDIGPMMDALGDPDCREVLRAMGTDALTASECSTACDLALSTAYRKLDRLAEADLVAERLRIRRDGKHTNEYHRRVEAVRLALGGDGGLELSIDRRTAETVPTGP